MARRCELTGKEVQFGHNVSHSKRATNRRFEPNIQQVRLKSEVLDRVVRLRIATRTIRTVQKKGGLDGFLLGTDDAKLMPAAQKLKAQIKKRLSGGRTQAG
ncbi:MAG: 50S ribosomal protein L28 [Myxococcota bacterium]